MSETVARVPRRDVDNILAGIAADEGEAVERIDDQSRPAEFEFAKRRKTLARPRLEPPQVLTFVIRMNGLVIIAADEQHTAVAALVAHALQAHVVIGIVRVPVEAVL